MMMIDDDDADDADDDDVDDDDVIAQTSYSWRRTRTTGTWS